MEKPDFDLSDASREKYRAEQLVALPKRYNPWKHLSVEVGVALAITIAAVILAESPSWKELLSIPAALLVSNIFEWWIHRGPMHRPWRRMKFIYDQHTGRHHRIYRHYDMAMRSWKEVEFVSFGTVLYVSIIAIAFIFAGIVWQLTSWNVALCFLATETLYVFIYELLHLAYHLPEGHPITRLGVLRRLAAWHTAHHDPRLMRKHNFNVTFPLADWLFRTGAPKEPKPTQ